ncbi:hypothetical protein [Paenibacillus pabuli]|uniref:hypothetical protein n=1 Tax=Paenibacillus pabuli TaxID=1472 RepID=UPI001430F2A6|nr:hypothetical protein [Paenibacillus pabuli]MEC0127488.1 hypothetical protein [Paenibacillus pabuli]
MDTKKGNIIFWSIIAAAVLIIGIAVLTKSLSNSNEVSAVEIEDKEVTTYDRFYHPSDYVIESLKNKAEKFEGYDYSHYLKRFRTNTERKSFINSSRVSTFSFNLQPTISYCSRGVPSCTENGSNKR